MHRYTGRQKISLSVGLGGQYLDVNRHSYIFLRRHNWVSLNSYGVLYVL